ncbi:MAG: polymer-forming cytoskeletal protein [Actinomycetia bacterium]|nr:polymer-forming cytoskeletal protein [Actinomycetes bacterium]
MILNKKPEIKGSKTVTIVAEGVTIEGKINSPGSTRIDGTVKGELISDKEIIIGKEGKVNANVQTRNAVIAGTFNGEMNATGEVEISSTGKFIGSLIQKDALLTITKGGLFKGESIISQGNSIPKTNNSKQILEEKS